MTDIPRTRTRTLLPTFDRGRACASSIPARHNLSAAEALSVARELRDARDAGDIAAAKDARDRLVLGSQGLVFAIAYTHLRQRVASMEDLVQVGNLAILRAADLFDVDRGFAWSTFACHGVDRHMRRAIAEGGIVRVPWCATKAAKNASSLGSVLRLARARAALDVASIEQLRAEDTSGGMWEWTWDDGESGDRAEAVHHAVHRALGGMRKGRDRQVVAMRFGLDGEEPATLEAIGRRHGFTKERARQIVAKSFVELKEQLKCFYENDLEISA